MSDYTKVKHLTRRLCLLLVTLFCCGHNVTAADRIRVGVDGGYSNIVIRISSEVESSDCRQIISNLQVLIIF